MIRVLIVEDSLVAQEFLKYLFSSDPALHVVAVVSSGEEALEVVKEVQPDVITMDIHLPGMDGFETTRNIMETVPTPIVIVSASTRAKDVASMFYALEAGALAIISRPPGLGHPGHKAAAKELIQAVKLMSEVKVVRRIRRTSQKTALLIPLPPVESKLAAGIQAVVFGASTGGPPVLQKILSGLPSDFPFPVFIVQHIASGFTKGFVEWLASASGFPVHIASHGEMPLSGHAYIAPEGFHLGVGSGPRVLLGDLPPENGLRPAVSFLFRTAAQALGSHAVGVLLTGMGKDGASELKLMKDLGAITVAQDENSSAVHGMPGEAIRLGAVTHVLSPESITVMLANLAKEKKERFP